jgi:hypothetical protein
MEKTLEFWAGPYSWRPFVTELQEFAEANDVAFAFTRKRRVITVRLRMTANGAPGPVEEFAHFARQRAAEMHVSPVTLKINAR